MFIIKGKDGQMWEVVKRGDKTYVRHLRYDNSYEKSSPAKQETIRRLARGSALGFGRTKGYYPVRTEKGTVLMPGTPSLLQRMWKGLPASAQHRSMKNDQSRRLAEEFQRSVGVPPTLVTERANQLGNVKESLKQLVQP
jgi:hypothetical protein